MSRIQPHLPVRLPCYDFTPITNPTFDGSLLKGWATGFGCCRLSWCDGRCVQGPGTYSDRKSTRLNSSHLGISYAVFCLKKNKKELHGKTICFRFRRVLRTLVRGRRL